MSNSEETCRYWAPSECERTVHCPPRCPRFVDSKGDVWVIRTATDADETALVDMYDDFAPGERAQGLPPRTRTRIESWVADRLEDGCNFVVVGDDRIVGHALYTPTDVAEPEYAVFVHQSVQGRGIGTELSKHVLATAAVGDRDALELVVEPDNRAARKLYDTLGFETVEERSISGGQRMGAIKMRRRLGPSAQAEFLDRPILREPAGESSLESVQSD